VTVSGAFDGMRVLVVEDGAEMREFLTRVLQFEGATVVSAHDGASALPHLSSVDGFDLITLDLGLPDMTGWDLLAEIRSCDPPEHQCPVVILSVVQDGATQSRAAELGAGFVEKPVGARELVEKLSAFLNRQ